jgi:2-amino-4-ketopentanoate thiolase alpha subunit
MSVQAGTRVEIRQRLLDPEERAPGLPPDTSRLPYEATVRGTLVAAAGLGDEARILTAAGRIVSGRLELVEPSDDHSFGRPVPALVAADEAIARLLRSFHG